jgi:hypothetical protein
LGFWRGVGYVFASIILVAGIISFPIGIVLIVPAVIWLWLLKKSGQVSSMQKELKAIRKIEEQNTEMKLEQRRKDAMSFRNHSTEAEGLN